MDRKCGLGAGWINPVNAIRPEGKVPVKKNYSRVIYENKKSAGKKVKRQGPGAAVSKKFLTILPAVRFGLMRIGPKVRSQQWVDSVARSTLSTREKVAEVRMQATVRSGEKRTISVGGIASSSPPPLRERLISSASMWRRCLQRKELNSITAALQLVLLTASQARSFKKDHRRRFSRRAHRSSY